MATTVIFDGTIPNYPTRTSWAAVPASAIYTITAPAGVDFEFSLDGESPFDLANSSGRLEVVNATSPQKAYRLANLPVAYMRVWWNSGGDPIDCKAVAVTL